MLYNTTITTIEVRYLLLALWTVGRNCVQKEVSPKQTIIFPSGLLTDVHNMALVVTVVYLIVERYYVKRTNFCHESVSFMVFLFLKIAGVIYINLLFLGGFLCPVLYGPSCPR